MYLVCCELLKEKQDINDPVKVTQTRGGGVKNGLAV